MGGGKSRVVVDYIQNTLPTDGLVLLVCPNQAVTNVWPGEFLKFGHPDTPVNTSSLYARPVPDRTRALHEALSPPRHRTMVAILNYEAAHLEPLAKLLLATPWDLIVMDESHRIKAPGGVQSRFMARLCANAKRVIALSGTPMPQGPIDIYAQARAIAPKAFGTSVQRFRDAYCVMGPSGVNKANGKPYPAFLAHTIQSYKNLADFHRQLATFTFHVEPDTVEAGLPDFTDTTVPTPLPKEAQAAYDELETEMCAELDGHFVTVDNALVKQLRLAQLTAGHWLDPETNQTRQVHTAKIDAALSIIDAADPSERFVIFARFRPEMADYHTAIQQQALRPAFLLMGGRDELQQWKNTVGAVLIVQIAAGAEAVSFVEARYQIYSTVTWSYSQYEQSRRRIRRHGQDRPVTYYHLIAPRTVDEDAHAALQRKGDVIESVRDGIRARAGRTT